QRSRGCALAMPVAQGVSLADDQRRGDDLPNGRSLGRSSGGGDNVQAAVAGAFDGGRDRRGRKIGGDGPRAAERRFKISVGDQVRSGFGHAAGHQLQVVDVAVTRRGEVNVEETICANRSEERRVGKEWRYGRRGEE